MDESVDELYSKYRGIIQLLAKSVVINNPSVVSREDLLQTGALALIVAAKSYNPSLGSFKSYIRKCIHRALLEQANSYNYIFTVDEKTKRQANKLHRLKRNGIPDDVIMQKLGIQTRATFSSLQALNTSPVDLDGVDILYSSSYDEGYILSIINEIDLTTEELQFITDLVNKADLPRDGQFYRMKTIISQKIIEWNRD